VKTNIFLFIAMSVGLGSCLLFKNLDQAIEDAAIRLEKRYDINLDSLSHGLGKNLVYGATTGLASDSSKTNINLALGNILMQFSDSLAVIISESKDSLLNEHTDKLINARIENLGIKLKIEVKKLLGGSLNTQIEALLDGVIDRFTSDESINRFRNLRDSLLGVELKVLTDSLVRSAVRNAIDEIAKGYDEKIKSKLDATINNADDVREKAANDIKRILIIAGVIGAVLLLIAGYFYLRAKRNRDTLKVVTTEINGIPERLVYDDLIKRIQPKVSERGLSNHLNQVLKEQNLLNQPNWKEDDRLQLDLMKNIIRSSPDNITKKELVKDFIAQMTKAGINDNLNYLFDEDEQDTKKDH
jgi:hypothetical protein